MYICMYILHRAGLIKSDNRYVQEAKWTKGQDFVQVVLLYSWNASKKFYLVFRTLFNWLMPLWQSLRILNETTTIQHINCETELYNKCEAVVDTCY